MRFLVVALGAAEPHHAAAPEFLTDTCGLHRARGSADGTLPPACSPRNSAFPHHPHTHRGARVQRRRRASRSLHAFDDAFLLNTRRRPADPARAGRRDRAGRERARHRASFSSLRPGLRSATAFAFGVLATVNGGRPRAPHRQPWTSPRTTSPASSRCSRASCWSASPPGSRSATAARAPPARSAAGRSARWSSPVSSCAVSHRHARRHGDRRHPLAREAGRRGAERGLQDRPLHRLRRRGARGLVPPVAQRRRRAADLRRRQQPHGPAAPREDARAPGLRRARLRPARHGPQRGHAQLLRLGLGARTSTRRSTT